MYHLQQEFWCSKLDELLGRRIDIHWPMREEVLDGKKTLVGEWCQGKVLSVLNKKDWEVNVMWDAMPDVKGFEESAEAWRMDADVELFENYYQDTDVLLQEEIEEEDRVDAYYESGDGGWTENSNLENNEFIDGSGGKSD